MNINELRTLVKKFVREAVVNEYFDRNIETVGNWSKISSDLDQVYFNTSSGNGYIIEFVYKILDSRDWVNGNNGEKIKLDGIINRDKYRNFLCVDIGYTAAENINTSNDDVYSSNTNRNEELEVMGRITNLVTQFINKNSDIFIYIIGEPKSKTISNTNRKYGDGELRGIIYKKMFNNTFSSKFQLYNGYSYEYEGKTMFFINKSILI